MLKELLPTESIIHIAGREYRIRYSLNALLCLEIEFRPLNDILRTEWYLWDIDTVLHLLHAAMCDMPWNKKAVIQRKFDRVRPGIFELGTKIQPDDLPNLRLEIADALIHAMPENSSDSDEKAADATDEGHLRAICVDMMGMSQREFWDSSYKDLDLRIDRYFEAKGLKEMPVAVKSFDKED